jgi:hypothetical protein
MLGNKNEDRRRIIVLTPAFLLTWRNVHLLSPEALHQLHIFIYFLVLAITPM